MLTGFHAVYTLDPHVEKNDLAIKRILIVDDDKEYRTMVKKLLNSLNYACEMAAGASEALDAIDREGFDLVISDILMEGKNGFELATEALNRYPGLDFILMSAYPGDCVYRDVTKTGALDFISKPFGLDEFRTKLQRIERERKVLHQLEKSNEKLQETCFRLKKTLEETINALASAVEIRDPYTAGHQRRVADLAFSIAHTMGCSVETMEAVRLAGLVHDAGKISIPSMLLTKPTRLKEVEKKLINGHAEAGYNILKEVNFPFPIAQFVLQHHERIDGSGYPGGLTGEQIHLESRIIAVADVVEAMSSQRPYRPALGIEAALEEIARNSNVLYDATAAEACLKLFKEQGNILERGPAA